MGMLCSFKKILKRKGNIKNNNKENIEMLKYGMSSCWRHPNQKKP